MVDRRTQQLDKNPSHNFNQSVAAGVKSLVGGSGRTFYVLKHLTASAAYPLGKEQEIIIEYIELGRDPKCQIRYDAGQVTVSRRHAAITKGPNGWVLRNLSQNNPTLINGRPVNAQWFLTSGDEIQLSLEGPKLRFIMPTNNSVNTIPLSRRLSLFKQQAMRPYRNAILALSTLLVVAIATFSWLGWQMKRENLMLGTRLSTAVTEGKVVQGKVDSLTSRLDLTKAQSDDIKKRNESLAKEMRSVKGLLKKTQQQYTERSNSAKGSSAIPPANTDMALLEAMHSSVYFLRIESIKLTMDDKTEEISNVNITGTGFLLSDGRFITTRHMVQPWTYLNRNNPDAAMILLNMVQNNSGIVNATLRAYSPDGSSFTFSSRDFKFDASGDETISVVDPKSNTNVFVKIGVLDDGKDWATIKTGRQGQISLGASVCEALPAGARLYTLGYPYGQGATSDTDIKPQFGRSDVASSGLINGMIRITDRNFDPGSSGGPAFYSDGTRLVAVGIISTSLGNQGGLVPVSHIR